MTSTSMTCRIWSSIILGAIVWWAIGLNLFIYHIVAFFLMLRMIQSPNRVEGTLFIPQAAKAAFFIFTFYAISVLIQTFLQGGGSRVIAAIYNLSFWAMAFFMILAFANDFRDEDIKPTLRTFYWLSWIIGGVAIVVFLLWMKGTRSIVIETPLYGLRYYLGRTQLVENSLKMSPLLFDWFASSAKPRFNIFSPYPTAAGGIIMITIIMITTYAAIERKGKNPLLLGLIGANIFALFMTLSRMSIMALFFSFIVVAVLSRKHVTLWMVFGVFLTLCAIPLIQDVLEYVLSLREGSNSIRLKLYRYSIEQLRGANWILGFGIKPRGDNFMFPLGSHSTYVSMLFKCGLVGFITLCVFQAGIFLRWYTLKAYVIKHRHWFLMWKGFGWALLAMGCWIVTEDIDAPQMLAFIYFSIIGMFEGFRRMARIA